MAPKSKVATGESKRALVVILVFFILATIGAAVAAYYGFAEQEKLTKAAEAAKKKEQVANEERDWYLFQSGILRAYLGSPAAPGSPVADELAKKPQFDAGTNYQKQKDYAEFKEIAAKLNTRSAWDAAKGAPKEPFEAVLKELQGKLDAKEKEIAKANDETAITRVQRTATQTDRTKDQAAFNAAVAKAIQDFKDEGKKYDDRIAKLEKDLATAEDKKNDTFFKPIVEENEKLKKDVIALNARVKDLDARLSDKTTTTTVAGTGIGQEKPAEMTERGKVLRVHINPRKLTIDLGKIHGLTAQTTFAVHGHQTNGKPRARSKANIEVINVNETTSEALVTEIFHPDPNTDFISIGKRKTIDFTSKDYSDPIVDGDALINSAWNPNAKTHIVIVGMIDLYGTGAISLASLVQILERQNIIVDAYIDPLDGAIKGRGLSRRTDFVLLGTKPTGKEPGGPRDGETLKAMEANYDKLLNDAKQTAIPLKQPHAFFRETGFNLPKSAVSD